MTKAEFHKQAVSKWFEELPTHEKQALQEKQTRKLTPQKAFEMVWGKGTKIVEAKNS